MKKLILVEVTEYATTPGGAVMPSPQPVSYETKSFGSIPSPHQVHSCVIILKWP